MAAAATPRARECAAPPAYGWSRRKRDWLLFLHADTRLPEGALARIESLNCRAGAFRHRFDSRDWRLRFISWATNQRLVRHTRPVLLEDCILTDARKFEKLGVVRATLLGLQVLLWK